MNVTTVKDVYAAQNECIKNKNERQHRMNHGLGLNEYGTTGGFAKCVVVSELIVFPL